MRCDSDAACRWRAKQCGVSRKHFSAATLLLLVAALAVVCGAGGEVAAKSKAVAWKVIDDALLRVNGSAVKDWGVYQAGRKTDPLLLQMGNRFLLIEIHERRLFELDPSKIEHKAGELVWDPADHPATPLATSDWVEHDVGGAFQIGAEIDSESRSLDLQLPHPPNVGELPARSATPTQRRNR
jgi:hypothetical protein